MTYRGQIVRAFVVVAILHWSFFAVGATKCRIEVFKSKRELQFFQAEKLVKTYRVALGTNPKPPKEREGDGATPEGKYYICRKNPKSQYYLSLGISYPSPVDAARGLKQGLITKAEHKAITEANRRNLTPPWGTKLGGQVYIHGRGSKSDWTLGCIALEDSDIRELYPLVPLGTPITIHE